MTIRLATEHDVPAMMALEERYFIGNLPPSQVADGFISIRHPRGWFDRAIDDAGLHVAVGDDGDVLGYIAVTPPPRSAAGTAPIMRAMLELAETVTFHGTPIAQQRYAFRGPVLIDKSARGQGIYSAFNEVMHRAYRPRYDVGVLFVSADNPRSLHTTTTKLGAEPLAAFEVDDKQYHFLAFTF